MLMANEPDEVLHHSKLTKLSNFCTTAKVMDIVLHHSKLTKLSNYLNSFLV